MKKIGAEVEGDTKKDSGNLLARVKGIVLGSPGKEYDMEHDDFVKALGENNDALASAVAEAVAKSLAPAEGETSATATEAPAAPAVEETTPALTAEDVAKAVSEAVASAIEEHVTKQYNEIFEAVLDRIAGIEDHLGYAARKSLDGQEGSSAPEATEPVTKSTPDLGDAILKAFAVSTDPKLRAVASRR
jgi:hypothetical protein